MAEKKLPPVPPKNASYFFLAIRVSSMDQQTLLSPMWSFLLPLFASFASLALLASASAALSQSKVRFWPLRLFTCRLFSSFVERGKNQRKAYRKGLHQRPTESDGRRSICDNCCLIGARGPTEREKGPAAPFFSLAHTQRRHLHGLLVGSRALHEFLFRERESTWLK